MTDATGGNEDDTSAEPCDGYSRRARGDDDYQPPGQEPRAEEQVVVVEWCEPELGGES